jgi:hypothetical protein
MYETLSIVEIRLVLDMLQKEKCLYLVEKENRMPGYRMERRLEI